MSVDSQGKRSRGLTIMLVFFGLVYGIGTIYLFLSWIGVQSYDPGYWQHDAMPFYALVFALAATGAYGILAWKKWGTYCLTGAWILTGILNSIFVPPTPIPYRYSFLAFLMVLVFFLFMLPAWQDME